MGGGTVGDHHHHRVFVVGGPKAEGTVPASSSTCGLSDNKDDSGRVVLFSTASSSIQQAEGAVQLYYVQTPDFPHSCCSDDASGVTIVYTAPGSGGGGAISSTVHEQLLVSSSQMIQEQCFVPFLPAQVSHETTHIIRDLQAIPVYADQRNPMYLKASAAADQAYDNWWNGRNAENHNVLAGTEDAAARARLHDFEQLHRGTLVGDGQGLSLSLSSQYQPQTSSLHFHSGRQAQRADAEMNNAVPAISQATSVVANDVITDVSSRFYPAGEPKFARSSRFRTPVRKCKASKAAIRHEFEIGCSSAGRGELPHEIEFCSGSGSNPADISRITNRFATSKFLRAAQELLVEVCSVVPPKRQKTIDNVTNCWNMQTPRNYNANISVPAAQAASVVELASQDPAQIGQEISSPLALISYHGQYITHSLVDAARKENREALLLKKDDLMNILNEVEARHTRYREHFRVMMNSFNIHAGAQTATPYLELAFQTMSCQFRAVRDATSNQLRMVRRALEEENVLRAGRGETSRHYQTPHHQLNCQQQALQQMGTPQQHHSWRPQRGLPERAVTILRDWMTTHFLHPYPNDADKLLLAKQTFLTRSQVSNWFINARVRLWKPMVEEMYMDEQRIAAQEANARRQLAETSGVPSKSLELFRRKLY